MPYAIESYQLVRNFGGAKGKKPLVALDHVNLQVEEGELFGLLGPNGAGKTTLIKILATLLLPSSGTVKVLGHDVEKEAQSIRPRINMVSGGETSGYGLLTVRENLWMFSQFYGIPSEEAKKTIDGMLELFGISDKANSKVRTISTGQRQKMNVIRGFVTDPDLIFLDEPTLGLDVNASMNIRNYIRKWVKDDGGKTVLLTTHYMQEAEQLCDRLAIIDHGRILACDTPIRLKKMVAKESTFTITTSPCACVGEISSMPGVKGFNAKGDGSKEEVRFVLEDEAVISDIISFITGKGAKVISLDKTEPTLEDVFIQLVGRGLE
ncbi:MAG: ABC transporter ATP-binding protein [Methanomassiliicoccales archaeon]|nr:ABC transporter ATP-binding protein [Methanomassiliicoccales archaeon]